MSDDDPLADEADHDADADADHEHDDHDHGESEGRVTSPMQDFSARQAAIGAVVLVIGLAIAFGIPYALT